MKFLLEILGMTNYCNLNCKYCDWEKKRYHKLSNTEIEKMKKNVLNIKSFADKTFPEYQIVEYSGGEPFMYPEVVDQILNVFSNKWIRIITNGLLVNDSDLQKIKKHGKAFLAISLDGINLESNINRFSTKKHLSKILSTIKKALELNIPIMLLCTLNTKNMDSFIDYVNELYKRFSYYVDKGLLVLPAHYLSQYEIPHDFPTQVQTKKLVRNLRKTENPICTNIKQHYSELERYILNRRKDCTIYKWMFCTHFLNDSIAKDGDFVSYKCGMRGVKRIGDFNINSSNVKFDYLTEYGKISNSCFKNEKCNCFVDWTIFDLILKGVVSLEQAKKWFVMFNDPAICEFVERYSKQS